MLDGFSFVSIVLRISELVAILCRWLISDLLYWTKMSEVTIFVSTGTCISWIFSPSVCATSDILKGLQPGAQHAATLSHTPLPAHLQQAYTGMEMILSVLVFKKCFLSEKTSFNDSWTACCSDLKTEEKKWFLKTFVELTYYITCSPWAFPRKSWSKRSETGKQNNVHLYQVPAFDSKE